MSAVQRGRDADRTAELTAALGAARARLARAAESVGRNVNEIELLPITKYFPATDVIILNQLGCLAFGESREQEAAEKVRTVHAELPDVPIRWHMVGRIQRKKARAVAGWAHTAHSVDSMRLLTALDRAAGEALGTGARAQPLRVYIQISLDGDTERGGVDVNASDLVDEICGSANTAEALEFVGLMGIPPWNGIQTTHSPGWPPNVTACNATTSTASNCRRGCPEISKARSNTDPRVCVSVPRSWGNAR